MPEPEAPEILHVTGYLNTHMPEFPFFMCGPPMLTLNLATWLAWANETTAKSMQAEI